MRMLSLVLLAWLLPSYANSDLVRMKSGEIVEFHGLSELSPFNGSKKIAIRYSITSRASSAETRNASRREIARDLAFLQGYYLGLDQVVLWEDAGNLNVGPLSASNFQSFEFERVEGTQWRQTSGDDLGWDSHTVHDYKAKITNNIVYSSQDGGWVTVSDRNQGLIAYQTLVLNFHAVGLTPKQAMIELDNIALDMVGCARSDSVKTDALPKSKLGDYLNLRLYAVSEADQHGLDRSLPVSVTRHAPNGVWDCRDLSFDSIDDDFDWSDIRK